MEKAGKGVSGKLSLICWALPVAVETKRSNRSEKTYPTRRWGPTRFYGEKFNDALRNAVAARLEELNSF